MSQDSTEAKRKTKCKLVYDHEAYPVYRNHDMTEYQLGYYNRLYDSVAKLHPNAELLESYVGQKVNIRTRCDDLENLGYHEFDLNPERYIRKKSWCNICSGRGTIENTKNVFMAKLDENEARLAPGSKYVKSNIKVSIICKENHRPFDALPKDVIRDNHWCPSCSGHCPIMAEQKFNDKVKRRGGRPNPKGPAYTNTYTHTGIICQKDHEFTAKPNNITCSHTWCPICKQSYLEFLVSEILTSFGLKFECEWRMEAGSNSRRFDFRLEFNGYDILIEVDGEQHFRPHPHWHKNPEDFEKRKLSDQSKNEWAIENGFRLIRIPHNIVLCIRMKLESIIKYALESEEVLMFLNPEIYQPLYPELEEREDDYDNFPIAYLSL